MPFDPTLPINNTVIDADELRAQFNGLKDLIDAVPAGPAGADGAPGASGNDGATGPQGPPFASAMVDGVTTLNPGESATVTSSFDGATVHLTFALPRGGNGSTGPEGPAGAPGEVTAAQLADAVAGTAANTNAVATLDIAFSDPPTLADLEALRAKLNELIVAQRR
jgi:hypothetical protein